MIPRWGVHYYPPPGNWEFLVYKRADRQSSRHRHRACLLMPGIKRKRNRSFKRSRKRSKLTVQRIVSRAINKNIETKHSVYSNLDGQEITHNNFIYLDSSLLKTTQGVTDPAATQVNNRIGDKITLKGVGIKMMLELNERFSDVTFRIMVIKAARGDPPNRANLFVGQSDNKMLDQFNKERFTVLYQKYVKMKAPGYATTGGFVPLPVGLGVNYARNDDQVMSRATRIVKFYVPGRRFVRSRIVQYDAGGDQPKFFDYHLLVYAYSNYSAFQDVPAVGRVNDFIKTVYYKDG